MTENTFKEICLCCNSDNTEAYVVENEYLGDVDMWRCDDCGETWQEDYWQDEE